MGFFAEVFREGCSKPLAVLDVFTLGKPVTLNDIFDFVIEREFFTRDALEESLAWLQADEHESWWPGKNVMAVVGIVMKMKQESA